MWAFPRGLVFKTRPSNTGDVGSIPGWGAKFPQGQKNKTQWSNVATNSIRTLKKKVLIKITLKKKKKKKNNLCNCYLHWKLFQSQSGQIEGITCFQMVLLSGISSSSEKCVGFIQNYAINFQITTAGYVIYYFLNLDISLTDSVIENICFIFPVVVT